MTWHPKPSLTVETLHWTSSNVDSVPLLSSSRLWDPDLQRKCKMYTLVFGDEFLAQGYERSSGNIRTKRCERSERTTWKTRYSRPANTRASYSTSCSEKRITKCWYKLKQSTLKARLLSRKSRFNDPEDKIEENSLSQGTKDNPATACRELSLIQPHLRDGHYYVDPNHGCPFDALRVFCNFTAGGLTCVSPVRSKISGMWPSVDRSKKWFSELHRGFKFEYRDLSVVQLRFLRLHSTSATQSISLTCSKKHIPTAKHQDTTKRVLHLRGDSNEDIHPSHVILSQHGCEVTAQVRVLGNSELHGGDMQLLPIRDALLQGSGETWEGDASIVLGHLCFL